MPRLGDISPVRAMQELSVRIDAAPVRWERWLPITTVSECCYRVCNPFEVACEVLRSGHYDQVAQALTVSAAL